MKKGATIFIAFIILILAIPALSLLTKQKENTDYSPQTKLQVKTAPSGDIEEITVKDYIIGVVAAEMPANFHVEALKAQAVAVHTYALRNISNQLTNPDETFDTSLLSTDSSQFMAYKSISEMQEMYGENYDAYYNKIADAVDSVFYEILTYEEQPILAAFHSMSSGKTEGAENIWGNTVSYLQPVDSASDEKAPNFESTVELSADEVREKLTEKWSKMELQESPEEWFSVEAMSESGTITAINVGNQTVSGTELRPVFGLKSANFVVSYTDNNFTFTTKGYGHGVGMSQYGADALAQEGKTYDEILLHYYTDVTITNLLE